jgi:hypothetical protein
VGLSQTPAENKDRAVETGVAWSGMATLGHQVLKTPIKKKAGLSI